LELARRVKQLELELEQVLAARSSWRPAGHYYSPIPDPAQVQLRAEHIFDRFPRHLPGIDLQPKAQVALLESFLPYYAEQPWQDSPHDGLRYGFENDQYSYSDALFLMFMLRHIQPRRVIEVGSGHSSAAMLDTADRFLTEAVDFTFIDPYPQRLLGLLSPSDRERVRVLETPVQDVPLETYDTLQAGDVLFIDSTHVSKTGSDVNHIFFRVLPRLAEGVYVHLHDIHYPFEYPESWVAEGRAWNEAYLLRAFLQFNAAFRVVCMNTALERLQPGWFLEHMPLCLKEPGGSIWLQRQAAEAGIT
jgi:hypothetical protein